MDNIGKLLAKNIKSARNLKDWTQNDLAVAAGVSFRSIQNIETGKRNPRPDTLAAIAGALGVSQESLYKEANQLTPSEATLKAIKQAVSEAMANKPEIVEVAPRDGIDAIKSLIDRLSYDDKISLANYATGSALGDIDLTEPAIDKRKLRR